MSSWRRTQTAVTVCFGAVLTVTFQVPVRSGSAAAAVSTSNKNVTKSRAIDDQSSRSGSSVEFQYPQMGRCLAPKEVSGLRVIQNSQGSTSQPIVLGRL